MDEFMELCNKINTQRILLYDTVEHSKTLYDPAIVIESQKLDKLIVEYTKAGIEKS